jgi:hypothetical protein
MTSSRFPAAEVPWVYSYERDVHLNSYFWWMLDLRIQFDCAISNHVFEQLADSYRAFMHDGLDTDRFRSWRNVGLCCYWFSQLGGDRYGRN